MKICHVVTWLASHPTKPLPAGQYSYLGSLAAYTVTMSNKQRNGRNHAKCKGTRLERNGN
jgi:hypothetical protein